MEPTTLETVEVDGMRLAYREMGGGPAVLLLHGWPTSSHLWRAVMPPISRSNRVVAIDLPGFGGSDKPVEATYDFPFFRRTLDGFLAVLGIDRIALAGHDLGGPVGLDWTMHNPGRVTKLALLNTLVYPEFSAAVVDFVQACRTPGRREEITGPAGLETVMRDGLADPASLPAEVLTAVREPFETPQARLALAAAGVGLRRRGFVEISQWLPTLRVPVRIVYGERDRLLPDVAETMARVKADVPQAEVTALPECGHFLQEEAPEAVGALLARFFAG
jgi:pimeloyl-ACP methyl ester carboxylesterase